MRKKGRADYARREVIVEPAFGQMKVRQHAAQLRLHKKDGSQGQWTLHAICHNMRKLMGVRSALGLGLATATWLAEHTKTPRRPGASSQLDNDRSISARADHTTLWH